MVGGVTPKKRWMWASAGDQSRRYNTRANKHHSCVFVACRHTTTTLQSTKRQISYLTGRLPVIGRRTGMSPALQVCAASW